MQVSPSHRPALTLPHTVPTLAKSDRASESEVWGHVLSKKPPGQGDSFCPDSRDAHPDRSHADRSVRLRRDRAGRGGAARRRAGAANRRPSQGRPRHADQVPASCRRLPRCPVPGHGSSAPVSRREQSRPPGVRRRRDDLRSERPRPLVRHGS